MPDHERKVTLKTKMHIKLDISLDDFLKNHATYSVSTDVFDDELNDEIHYLNVACVHDDQPQMFTIIEEDELKRLKDEGEDAMRAYAIDVTEHSSERWCFIHPW